MKKLKAMLSAIAASLFFSPFTVSAEQNYPESFDLRDYGIVSSPADQGNKATCWAFSFLGSADTKLLSVPGYGGLSEWYLAYSAFNGTHQFRSDNPDQPAYSGTPHIASSVLTSWRGFASYSDIPFYYTEDQIMQYEFRKPSVPEYIIKDISLLTPWIARKSPADKDTVKELLMKRNSVSVTCSLNESETVFSSENSALFNSRPDYNCKNDPYYHSVLIIGWDDAYSRENFSSASMPENDGAWIVKNSYGSGWGNNGFFYISYEDTSLQEPVSCTEAEKNPYTGIYQYDHFGWTTSLPSDYVNLLYPGTQYKSSRQGYMANIFQASAHEDVSAVSFYTIEPGAGYEITVRSEPDNPGSPISGTVLSSQSGVAAQSGYHTISLDTPAEIKTGEYFSVSVKITNPDSIFTIPIEACIFTSSVMDDGSAINISNITSINRKVHSGESFISPDGRNWYDICVRSKKHPEELSTTISLSALVSGSSDNYLLPPYPDDEHPVSMACGNVCLKAFTVPHSDLLLSGAADGDINGDGTVNIRDFITAVQAVLKSENIPNADFNKDGHTDSADILTLKRLFFN